MHSLWEEMRFQMILQVSVSEDKAFNHFQHTFQSGWFWATSVASFRRDYWISGLAG